MIHFTNDHDLSVPVLSGEEKRWVIRLARVLRDCPERLELLTSGGLYLSVIDQDGARESELCDGAAGRDGVALASILLGRCLVHGVSG